MSTSNPLLYDSRSSGDLGPPVVGASGAIPAPKSPPAPVAEAASDDAVAPVAPLVDRDAASWVISLAVHIGLLVLLALMIQQTDRKLPDLIHVATQAPTEHLPEEVQFAPEPLDAVGANSVHGQAAALASAPVIDDVSKVQTEPLQVVETLSADTSFMPDLSTAPKSQADFVLKGSAGVGTTGAEGAIDRLTQEILLSLEQRPTLVVWLFDQSGSLQFQRDRIQKRFDRIYEELGLLAEQGNAAFARHADQPLLTAVMAFGQQVTFRTEKPTADLDEIKTAVRGIENDPSGIEMTFTAIGMAAQKFARFRMQTDRRNVMLIVVSDEVGNDDSLLDATLNICRRQEMPVYCIGVPAPFGQREALVRYVDPDPDFDQSVQMIPVLQGPESALPEHVQLGFSSQRDLDDQRRLDSGFGPFALTRLCYETGGIYFTVHPNRPEGDGAGRNRNTAVMSAQLNQFFDPSVMRNYLPDYLPAKKYEQLLKENSARASLVAAARMSLVDPMTNPRLVFPKRNEADLKNQLDMAQRAAAVVEPKIDQLYNALKQGEKDRAKLTGLRWQAGYDLAMGRALAVKVRTVGYNTMLAKAKNGMKFDKPGSDTWVLAASDEILSGSALEKMAKQSREYLERVKQEHPGTPWAYLAERELTDPLGWKWTERHTGVNEPRPRPPNNNNPPPMPRNDMLRKLEKPKPVRQNVKL